MTEETQIGLSCYRTNGNGSRICDNYDPRNNKRCSHCSAKPRGRLDENDKVMKERQEEILTYRNAALQ